MPLSNQQKSNRISLRRLSRLRHRRTWRGKDLKKLAPIPWLKRDIVFTCSNAWTIERIYHLDWWLEGLLMGHCLGLENGPGIGEFYSLRDLNGIPHATIEYGTAIGRCNGPVPEKYMALIREWRAEMYTNSEWGTLDQSDYEKGILNDTDYRDMSNCGSYYRDKAWQEKRNCSPVWG